MHAFGYQVLVTVFLPGAMLAASLWMLLARFLPESRIFQFLQFLISQEWLGALTLLLAASLLGTFLASVLDYLESHTFDLWERKRLNLSKNEYWCEWESYVDSLEEAQNPFITQMTLFFAFESRSAVAAVFLGAAWTLYGWSFGEFVGGSLIIALGWVLFRAAKASHRVLADYRHRRWPSSPTESAV